jgi:hypothetical protein
MRQALLTALLLFLCPLAHAQDTAALINKALDEQVKLNLNGTLPQVLQAIHNDRGVQIQADPAVWELLPWGRETNVTAKIENLTLREALTLIMRKLGLTLVLRDEAIEIQPMPALKRLGQRASVTELKSLDLLASTPLNLATDKPTIAQLLEAVDKKLEGIKDIDLAVENRTTDKVKQDKIVFVPRNATLMDAMDSLHKQTDVTWYPWYKNILVVTKDDRTRAMLDKPVTILRPGEGPKEIMQVLLEVAKQTGVQFEFQPGVISTIPADARNLRGVIENAPARQVLEAMSATTGLSYTVQNDKVYVTSAQQNPAAGRDPVIGIIQLDTGIQVLVPTSQVPPDLREYLRHKTQKELKKIREMMEDEGFKPTTQPAEDNRDL